MNKYSIDLYEPFTDLGKEDHFFTGNYRGGTGYGCYIGTITIEARCAEEAILGVGEWIKANGYNYKMGMITFVDFKTFYVPCRTK